MYIITLACTGSGGVGFNFVWINIEIAIIIGNIPIGILNPISPLIAVSGFDKSCIHPIQGAPRISTLNNKTQYKDMNTGI